MNVTMAVIKFLLIDQNTDLQEFEIDRFDMINYTCGTGVLFIFQPR